jgi:DnaK suppressor protein
MTSLDTTPYKTQLLQQRAALLAQLAQLRGGAIGRVQASTEHFATHEDSSAQTATERELEFALDDHETTELAAVDAALQRIATGSYGVCTTCGTQIPTQRLAVAPQAARCMPCQEKAEHP